MNEPNSPLPPNLPPPNPTPAGSNLTPVGTVAKKKSAKPWIWSGCGCLTLLLILAIVGFFYGARFIGQSNTFKRFSGKYDPYKGTLTTLLPEDLSSGVIKFHLVTKLDATPTWKEAGGTEAISFTYDQIAAGLIVKVKGMLVNFPSSERAQQVLKTNAKGNNVDATAKEKGLRFSAKEGEIVGWTNGSLVCIVYSDFARPPGNFENAAPF